MCTQQQSKTFPKARYEKIPKIVRKWLDGSNFTPHGTMDKAALESLLTQVSQACPEIGIFHFFENNSGCDDMKASGMLPQALDDEKISIY